MEEEFRVQDFEIFGIVKQDKEKKCPLKPLQYLLKIVFLKALL
jgi:hypothetical protein